MTRINNRKVKDLKAQQVFIIINDDELEHIVGGANATAIRNTFITVFSILGGIGAGLGLALTAKNLTRKNNSDDFNKKLVIAAAVLGGLSGIAGGAVTGNSFSNVVVDGLKKSTVQRVEADPFDKYI